MSRSHSSAERLSLAIAASYEPAVSPERWPVALAGLRDLFGVAFALSEFRDPARPQVDGVALGIEGAAYRRFLREQFQGSPFYAPGIPWYVGQVARTVDLLPDEVFHRTALYQEVWRPCGMRESLRMAISIDDAGSRHVVNLAHADGCG